MRSRSSLMSLLIKQGFDPFQILYRMMLRKALIGCDRVLDAGCGSSMSLRWIGIKSTTGIEGYRPAFEEAKRKLTHDELFFGDVRTLDEHFRAGQFDACVSLDVIEHLNKEDGLKLLASLERIARHKIIIATPNGWLTQFHLEDGDLQEHLSGWSAAEMESYGYEVVGMLGPKILRAGHHALRWRPKWFWGLVALLTHVLWTRRHPAKAAAILCVKTKLRP